MCRDRIGGEEAREEGCEKNAVATVAAAEERGTLFRMREKENEGEFESGKTVG